MYMVQRQYVENPLGILHYEIRSDGKKVTTQDKSHGRHHLNQHPSDAEKRTWHHQGVYMGSWEGPSGKPKRSGPGI